MLAVNSTWLMHSVASAMCWHGSTAALYPNFSQFLCCAVLRCAVLCCVVYDTDRVPHVNDVEAWDRMCFGRGAAADTDLQLPVPSADDSAEMTQLSPSICSKIMALEQVSVMVVMVVVVVNEGTGRGASFQDGKSLCAGQILSCTDALLCS